MCSGEDLEMLPNNEPQPTPVSDLLVLRIKVDREDFETFPDSSPVAFSTKRVPTLEIAAVGLGAKHSFVDRWTYISE
jgi:hypothetical protein